MSAVLSRVITDICIDMYCLNAMNTFISLSFCVGIIVFKTNRNYRPFIQISASGRSNWPSGFEDIPHHGRLWRYSKWIHRWTYVIEGLHKQKYWRSRSQRQDVLFCTPFQLVSQPSLLINRNFQRSNLPTCRSLSNAFLSSSQTCIRNEFKMIRLVIELMWVVQWKST